MTDTSLINIIKKYFEVFEAGSAKDIYFKLGKRVSYKKIQEVLDELEKVRYIQNKTTRSTQFVRPHYVYYRTFNKEHSTIFALLRGLLNCFVEVFK